MIIGFTGTQKQMTLEQFDALYCEIEKLDVTEGHHGDCVGADFTFHAICVEENIPVVIHPPLNESKRAFCEAETILEQKDYIVRNHDIVDASDVVFACPPTMTEVLRSGTWATWRYAKKTGKMTYLILPTGEVQCDSP